MKQPTITAFASSPDRVRAGAWRDSVQVRWALEEVGRSLMMSGL